MDALKVNKSHASPAPPRYLRSTNGALFFEELHVGDHWRSQGRTITETDIVSFAGLTGDFEPLHVDHEYARSGAFKRPIAHGLLGLSYLAGLGTHAPCVRTAAFVGIREWEFLKPIYVGDTIYAEAEIVSLELKGRKRGHVVWKRQLVNHRGEIVQTGIFETLVESSKAGERVSNKLQ